MWFPLIALHLKRVPEALEKICVARRILPDEPLLIAVGGLAAAYEGDFARTKESMESALGLKHTLLHTHHLWHVAASGYAMCGKPEEAVSLLRRCVETGLPNYALFKRDPHLQNLIDFPEFRDMMLSLRRESDQFRQEFGAQLEVTDPEWPNN
jgi:hypothetical protein